MNYGHHPQRHLIRCVHNQVFPYENESQRPRTKIRAAVTLVRKIDKPANDVKYFVHDAVGRVRVILRDVTADLVEISEGFRMERVPAAYAERLPCAWVFTFRREKASSPSIGFTPPLFRSS